MWQLRNFWLPIAQGLPVGSSQRVANPHEPNSRASVLIRHSTTGYSAWDFRNRTGDWVDKTIIFDLIEDEKLNSLELPSDMELVEDLEEFYIGYIDTFLYSRGITRDMLKRTNRGLYFSPDTGRLITECRAYSGKELTSYFVGRDMTGRSQAKYLSYREKAYQTHDVVGELGKGSKVVLTEDSYSAVKINYSTGLTSISLSGTMIRSEVLLQCADYDEVIVWLDGDEAGVTGALDVMRELRGVASKVRDINIWGKDPKDLFLGDIRKLVLE